MENNYCKSVFIKGTVAKESLTEKWIEMVKLMENNKYMKSGDK